MIAALQPSLPGVTEPERVGRWASFDRDRRYRWTLGRRWQPGQRTVLWIMLNPSTADGLTDDPTVRRVMQFSRRWCYDRLVVVNLYPIRTSDPREARRWADWPSRQDWYARDALMLNQEIIVKEACAASDIVAAWGASAWCWDWSEVVIEEIQYLVPTPPIHCLGLTANGRPKHPLARGQHRVPDNQQPVLWR